MPTHRVLAYALGAILIAAPLPFGSVEPWATGLLVAACCAVGLVWVVWRARRGLPGLPWKEPAFAAGAVVISLGALQLVALPRPVLGLLSPRAVEFRDRYEPAPLPVVDPGAGATVSPVALRADTGRRPISLYPWATRQSVLKFAACWLALLVTLDLASIGATHRTLAAALILAGGFQAIYGLAEYFTGHQHIFGYSKEFYADVATGTFINRNHFAGFLGMTIPLAIAFAATSLPSLRNAGRSLGERLAAVPGRVLFRIGAILVLALIMTTALVCSRSRMGIASTVLALIAVGGLLAWRGRRKGFILAVLLVGSITFLLFSHGGAGDSVVGRFLDTTADIKAGLGRWSLWTQTIRLMRAFPVTGVGLGAFPAVFPAFRSTGEGFHVDHAHNDFLEFAAEAGVIGIVALGISAFLVLRALRPWGSGSRDLGLFGHAAMGSVLVVVLHSVTDFNLAIPSNAVAASVLLGMAVCWARSPSPILAIEREPHRAWLTRSLLPASAIAAIAGVAVAPPVLDRVALSRNETGEPRLAVAAVEADVAGPARNEVRPPLLWGNPARLSEMAAKLGAAAARDMQILSQARDKGDATSEASVKYVESRLREAVALQSLALRHNPVSAEGHVALGHLRAAHCAAVAMMMDVSVDCVREAMPEFGLAVQLSPLSTSINTRVVSFLRALWPVMTEDQRTAAVLIVNRAVVSNEVMEPPRQNWTAGLEHP